MKQGMILVLTMGTVKGVNMTKYKLYSFSGAMYIVTLDTYRYVDDIAESYFENLFDFGFKRFNPIFCWCDYHFIIRIFPKIKA